MVLGKLPVLQFFTTVGQGPIALAVGWVGWFGHFYSHLSFLIFFPLFGRRGWSGGAKVLGKLSVPGRPTSLDDSRARAYCACSRCGWGLFGHFPPIYLFFLPLFGRRPDID